MAAMIEILKEVMSPSVTTSRAGFLKTTTLLDACDGRVPSTRPKRGSFVGFRACFPVEINP